MGPMETFLFMAVAIPVVAAVAMYSRRGSQEAWREAAQGLGLQMKVNAKGEGSLQGDIGSASMRVDLVERQRERKTIPWTRIRAQTDIPPGLLVGGEGFWKRWSEDQGEDVVDMAGVAFDEHVIARGSVPHIFALLNGDTRTQFRELEKHYRAYVVEGTVHVERQGVIREAEELSRLTRRVATLAMALSLHGPSIVDRLGANVVTDPNALVRLRNLELLLDRYPDAESTRLACQHALVDRSDPVSVLAARQCAEEGFPTLERVLRDDKSDPDLRLKSLEHLVGLMEPEDALGLLVEVMERDEALKSTAIVTLASIGQDPGADVLLSLLVEGSSEGWIAYAQAVTALGREELLEPLELLLDQDAETNIVTMILQALEDDERFVKAPPITLELPDELRMDLDVQKAAQDAMRELRGWTFELQEDNAEPEVEEASLSEEVHVFEQLDLNPDEDSANRERVDNGDAPTVDDISTNESDSELEPQAE